MPARGGRGRPLGVVAGRRRRDARQAGAVAAGRGLVVAGAARRAGRRAVGLAVAVGNHLDRRGVVAVLGPAVGEVVEAHRAPQRRRQLDDVVLLLARARRRRIGNVLARVGDEVLHLRLHAGRDVREAVARHAAASGADAGEIVLAGMTSPRLPSPRLKAR